MNEKITNFCSFSVGLEQCSQIFAHLGGGMDCVTAPYAGIVGSSPTEKVQKVPFSFIHNNPPISI